MDGSHSTEAHSTLGKGERASVGSQATVGHGLRSDPHVLILTDVVMQDDSLIGALTVFECLDYVAQLKLPGLTKEQRRHKVDTVIQQLDIWKIRDSIIGTQFRRGISGGERRRVAIGVELITSPSVLFLDEPTSGLDGASAYTVMKTIIDLGKTGCTVLCTIHQVGPTESALHRLALLTCCTAEVQHFFAVRPAAAPHFWPSGIHGPSAVRHGLLREPRLPDELRLQPC